MISASLDTNTILRFLSNDIPSQAERVQKRLEQAEDNKLILTITPFILVEVVFHLTRWYKLSRPDTTDILIRFLTQTNLDIPNLSTVLEALKQYSQTSIDFVDLLLWATVKNSEQLVLSFDKHLDKLTPKLRLQP